MSRKLKNTLILAAIVIAISLAGGTFTFWHQDAVINEKHAKIKELNLNVFNTKELTNQLNTLKLRSAELDSILSLRKFIIPYRLRQSAFFQFVNKISFNFMPYSYVNIDYVNTDYQNNFNFYTYKLTGVAAFNDFYKLVYAIEHSKELKKIESISLTNLVQTSDSGVTHYLVNYAMYAKVYFSNDNRFASSLFSENNLRPNPLYDVFYPLIRNQIPPNKDHLLDVQSAHLLALVPDGAFLSDDNGNTYLLWEGDKVYLGYLTKIDYDKSEVKFVINRGGIVDWITLPLEKAKNKKVEKKKK